MAPADLRKQRLAEWIGLHLGTRTLTEFAADISEATGWPIDYSRLGRYRNRKLQVGRTTVDHFNAYAAKRDLPPIDLSPAAPVLDPTERMARALESIAESLVALRGDVARQAGTNLGATQTLGAQLTAILERMPDAP